MLSQCLGKASKRRMDEETSKRESSVRFRLSLPSTSSCSSKNALIPSVGWTTRSTRMTAATSPSVLLRAAMEALDLLLTPGGGEMRGDGEVDGKTTGTGWMTDDNAWCRSMASRVGRLRSS